MPRQTYHPSWFAAEGWLGLQILEAAPAEGGAASWPVAHTSAVPSSTSSAGTNADSASAAEGPDTSGTPPAASPSCTSPEPATRCCPADQVAVSVTVAGTSAMRVCEAVSVSGSVVAVSTRTKGPCGPARRCPSGSGWL
eukprot:350766-Chlamydomonas_euryale.AAC.3